VLDEILRQMIVEAVKEGVTAAGNGDPDEVLTVEGAMEFLKVESVGWVYRHADELGAVRLSSKCLRFTRRGLMAYLEDKKKGR
jgi:hypothetical protein